MFPLKVIHTYYNTYAAWMFGDPHIVTLDGHQYTFNGKGEFVLAETLDGSFLLQGRMTEPRLSTDSEMMNNISEPIRGTTFESLAIKEGDNPIVQLEIVGHELRVLANGERVDFSAVPEQRFANVTITDIGNSTYSVRFTSGVSVTAAKFNSILTNILITLPEHYAIRGLLGQFNGDPSDDLLPKNNPVPLPTNASNENIHYNFGLSCKFLLLSVYQTLSSSIAVYINACRDNQRSTSKSLHIWTEWRLGYLSSS